jgi:hypothetical protein
MTSKIRSVGGPLIRDCEKWLRIEFLAVVELGIEFLAFGGIFPEGVHT